MRRTYLNLSDIIAVGSGIFNIIRLFIAIFCFFINLIEQKLFLFQMIFDTKTNNTNTKMAHSNIISSLQKINTINSKIEKLNNNYINLSKQPSNIVFINDSFMSLSTKMDSFNIKKKNNNIKKHTLFCPFRTFNKFKRFGKSYIERKFDVSSYHKLLKEFMIVKNIFLSKTQLKVLNQTN